MPKHELTPRFTVIDGNKRLAAIRILEKPSIVGKITSLSHSEKNKLRSIIRSSRMNEVPHIDAFICKDEAAARHWSERTRVPRGGGVAAYFVTAVFVASFSAGLIPGIFWNENYEYFAEYFSYDFASIAAVLAGLGLYYRHEKIWFWVSGLFVLGGLAAFVVSKPGYLAVTILFLALMGILHGIILLSIRVNKTKNMPFNMANVFFAAISIAGLFASIYIIYNIKTLNSPKPIKSVELNCSYTPNKFEHNKLHMVCNNKEGKAK